MARVFVTRSLPGPALGRLESQHETDVWPERLPPPPDELRRRTGAAEGLLSMLTDPVVNEPVSRPTTSFNATSALSEPTSD